MHELAARINVECLRGPKLQLDRGGQNIKIVREGEANRLWKHLAKDKKK